MNSLTRQTRFRLDRVSYRELRRQVLRRDGWRCQICGRGENLDVHHRKRRSALGHDSETNLITLCRECHQLSTAAGVVLIRDDLSKETRSVRPATRFERRIDKLIGSGVIRQLHNPVFQEGSRSRAEYLYWRKIWLCRPNGSGPTRS
jgi:predicted restriction endonuclease